jgi:hypothetical protein
VGASKEAVEPIVLRGSAPVKIAAISFIADTGFAMAMPIALRHLVRTGELPMTPWGFRAFAGPFEQLGAEKFTALGWTLVGVCTLDVVAGVWLWQGKPRGAALGLATTPIAFGLAAGFALPFLLVPVPLRAALVLIGRRSLRARA